MEAVPYGGGFRRRLSTSVAKAVEASFTRKQSESARPRGSTCGSAEGGGGHSSDSGDSGGDGGGGTEDGGDTGGGGSGGPSRPAPQLPPPPRRSMISNQWTAAAAAARKQASSNGGGGFGGIGGDGDSGGEGGGGGGGGSSNGGEGHAGGTAGRVPTGSSSNGAPAIHSNSADIAKDPRACLAVMISRAVNVQIRSQSALMAQINSPTRAAARWDATAARAQPAPPPPTTTASLWDTVRQRDESDLWLPDFAKTRSIDVHGFFNGVDFAPRVFESLRQHFGINSGRFAADMGRLGEGKEGEGKSKQLFFQTENQKYIIKTIKDLELEYFLGILGDYYYHMLANKHTLICRFYGLYSVTMPKLKRTFTFVVMSNNFHSPLHIPRVRHKFDLKGSTKNRLCSEEDMEDGYVGKDLNFTSCLYLDPRIKKQLMAQLKIDAWFLQVKNLMDYSLLLGLAPLCDGKVPTTPADFDGPFCSDFQKVCGGMLVSMTTPPPEGLQTSAAPAATQAVAFMGIIDILQPYSMKKQMETQMKAKPGDAKDFSYSAISAVPAQAYAYRFLRYVNSWVRSIKEMPRASRQGSPPAASAGLRRVATGKSRRLSSVLM